MKMDDFFGMIGNDLVMDGTVNDVVISVYVTMRTVMYDITNKCSIVSLSALYELLTVSESQGTQTKEIKTAIEFLIENQYITLHDMFHKEIEFNPKSNRTYKVNFLNEDDSTYSENGGFTPIPKYNLTVLLEHIVHNKSRGFKKYQLIRYYSIIARVCSNSNKFGYISNERVQELIGLSPQKFKENNDLLQELGLIYYNNEYGYTSKSGFNMYSTMFGHRNVVMGTDNTGMTYDNFVSCIDNRLRSSSIKKLDKEVISGKKSEAMKKVWEERKKIN